MGRLSRLQMQARNRAKVLAAARDEFTERGFHDAKIDTIAERAELTRGAVYSNFPGKRALYFAVLADDVERGPRSPHPRPGHTAQEALGVLARAWVARLPLATDEWRGAARLGMDLMPEILGEEQLRQAFAQLMKLEAIVVGLALERLDTARSAARMVRVAETALTTLHGVSRLAAAAPGFVEPFDVVRACEHMAILDLDDTWPPPHAAHIATRARPADEPWSPPSVADAVRGEPAQLTRDNVLAILGLHRLEAIEEAVRAAPAGVGVVACLVTDDPGEMAPLARLAVGGLGRCLYEAFPPSAWPDLQVVCAESATLAAAAGVPAVDDVTEVAVRVVAGRIVARAVGRGACQAAASSGKLTS